MFRQKILDNRNLAIACTYICYPATLLPVQSATSFIVSTLVNWTFLKKHCSCRTEYSSLAFYLHLAIKHSRYYGHQISLLCVAAITRLGCTFARKSAFDRFPEATLIELISPSLRI